MGLVYVDMDGVLADYESAVSQGKSPQKRGFYLNLYPIEGALAGFRKLCQHHDVFILTSPSWVNLWCWMEKRQWVEGHLPESCIREKVIFSHRKDLLVGDYLIDDRTVKGAGQFSGEHIHFGTPRFPDWAHVLRHLV